MSDDRDRTQGTGGMPIQISSELLAASIQESSRRIQELGYVSHQHIMTMRRRMADVHEFGDVDAETAASFERLLERIDVTNMGCVDALARRAFLAIGEEGYPPTERCEMDAVVTWATAHDAVYGFSPIPVGAGGR